MYVCVCGGREHAVGLCWRQPKGMVRPSRRQFRFIRLRTKEMCVGVSDHNPPLYMLSYRHWSEPALRRAI